MLLAGDAVSAGCLSASKCARLMWACVRVCMCLCVYDTREGITDVVRVCGWVHWLRLEVMRLPACLSLRRACACLL